MGQKAEGMKSILSHPIVYSSLQSLLGAKKSREEFVRDFIRPSAGISVLDIGCGPADILGHFPDVNYYGFDISEQYITHAKKNFGHRGQFYAQELTVSVLDTLPLFDIVLGIGLLHHLDDLEAIQFITLAKHALKSGGRLITLDGCFDDSQSRMARFLLKQDRGQNIRYQEGYRHLVSAVFETIDVQVRHRSWIPYTHCLMDCKKS